MIGSMRGDTRSLDNGSNSSLHFLFHCPHITPNNPNITPTNPEEARLGGQEEHGNLKHFKTPKIPSRKPLTFLPQFFHPVLRKPCAYTLNSYVNCRNTQNDVFCSYVCRLSAVVLPTAGMQILFNDYMFRKYYGGHGEMEVAL